MTLAEAEHLKMNAMNSRILLSAALMLGVLASPGRAQLPAPNEAGVSTGHIHLTVPDTAEHGELWERLGGQRKPSGAFPVFAFPGMYILLSEGQPAAPSSETTVNHIGFSVRDYPSYRETLAQIGAEIFYENAEDGQILADLPDGVRVELLSDASQEQPIEFHHVHLAASDGEAGLRDWYLDVFGAEPGERRGLPSALVPGGRVDVMPAGDGQPRGSRGAAIDHIGFEVADMDAFAAKAEELGIGMDQAPTHFEEIGLTIAFITDPAGTYIEITEGLESAVE